jgi:predicted DNA-binding transcriptional regulator YafY
LTHDSDKLIRQLSLVAYLMAEQRPVTARDVKNNVEGYANMGDEAFARRYYADRSELQGLGVPITSGRDEFTGEELYNLRQEHYFLPPIDLTDAELAALQTSFYLLEGQFAYAEPLRLALQNLALGRAHPIDPGPNTAKVELLGSVYTPEISQRLAKLEQAISKQRTIRFTYWTASSDTSAERTVNPYGLFELSGVWYVVGDDCDADDPAQARKTFRISRIRGEIKFATRRERDFRIPADFNVTAYRDRKPWQLEREPAGVARLSVAADDVWLVDRLYGGGGELEEHEDGSATLTTEYSNLEALSQAVLHMNGRMQPTEPDELIELVRGDLARVIELHEGDPSEPGRPAATATPPGEPAASSSRTQGPVAPERFALLQALLAFLLERCGDDPSATVLSDDIRARFHLSQEELQEHLDLLNLVNFGGGCYAVYCSTENGSVLVDKELYGDTFRRPARLSPLEAKALLRALDVVSPVIAAESHSSLQTVRDKIAQAFGQFTLADTPEPHGGDGEESAVTTLNEGVRCRRQVRIGYHSRSSNEFSERVIEPYLLRRDQRGWYVEAYDRTKEGRRTFKVEFVRDAELLADEYEPREEMRDLDPELGGKVGTARVLFSPARGRYEREGRPDVTMLADGSALALVSYGSLSWLVPEILKHRGEAEVLDPPHLRGQVGGAASKLQRALSRAPTRS